jgi:hypothetical protein
MARRPIRRPTRSARPMVLTGLIVGLALVIAFLPRAADRDRAAPPVDPAAQPDQASEGQVADDEPFTWVPADSVATLSRLSGAIDRLLSEPRIQVRGESDLDGSFETFVIDIDRPERSFASTETVGNEQVGVVAIERIETPSMQYVRVTMDGVSERVGEWSEIPVSTEEQLELETAYTLFGRVTPDLARLPELWTRLNIDVQQTEYAGRTGIRIVARTDDLSIYLRDNRIANVGPSNQIGSTIWNLWFEQDELVRLEGRGVQFFHGEPFRSARIDIEFVRSDVRVGPPTGTG